MKISIDLLPENRKAMIAKKRRFRDTVKQEILFIFPFIIFILMMLGTSLIIQVKTSSDGLYYESQQDQGEHKDLRIYENRAKEINASSSNILNFKSNHFIWTNIINDIIGILPEKIIISNLYNINYKIFIIGSAESRDALINMKDKISENNCYENINVPISNLVIKDNFSFQIDLDIKKECLLGK